MADFSSVVALDVDASGSVRGVQVFKGAMEQAEKAANQAAKGVDKTKDASNGLLGAVNALRRPLYDLRFALVSLGAAAIVRNIFRMNDAFEDQNSKLRLVTQSERELTRVRGELYKISQTARVGIEDTITLYSRMSMAVEQLGISEERRLAITKTITEAVRVSGATQQEASNAIRQLTQALGAGIFRAEEYNSIVEQTPFIMQAVANGMEKAGGSTAVLRSMMLSGELTARDFIEALESQSGAVSALAGQVERTLSQSLVQLNNAFLEFIGSSERFDSINDALIAGIDFVRESMEGAQGAVDLLGGAVNALAIALGAYLTPRLIAAAGAMTAATSATAALTGAMSLLMKTAPMILGGAAVALTIYVRESLKAKEATKEANRELEFFITNMERLSRIRLEEGVEVLTSALAEAEEKLESLGRRLPDARLGNASAAFGGAIQKQWREQWRTVQDLSQALQDAKAKLYQFNRAAEENAAVMARMKAGTEAAALAEEEFLEAQEFIASIDPRIAAERELNLQQRKLNEVAKLLNLSDEERMRLSGLLIKAYTDKIAKMNESGKAIEYETAKINESVIAAGLLVQRQAMTTLGLRAKAAAYGEGAEAVEAFLREERILGEIQQWMADGFQGTTAEARKLIEEVIDGQQAIEEAAEAERKAAEEAEARLAPWNAAWERMIKSIDDAFASVWKGAFDGFESFADSLKNAFKNLLAELAHLAITKPIMISIMGAVGVPGAADAAGNMLGAAGAEGGMGGMLGGALGGGLGGLLGGGGGFVGTSASGGFLGMGGLMTGGTGGLGTMLFGTPSVAGMLGGGAATTGGLLSAFSGFGGGIGSGVAGIGQGLAGQLGTLSTFGAWGAAIAAAALAAQALGAFDDFGASNTRIQLNRGFATDPSQSGADPRFFRQTGLGVSFAGQRITEITEGGPIVDAVASLYDTVADILNGAGRDLQGVRDALVGDPAAGSLSREYVNADPATILQDEFDLILTGIEPAIADFVREVGGSLEDQINALAAGFALDDLLRESGVFGGIEDAMEQLAGMELPGESLADTATRVVGSMELMRLALEGVGLDADIFGDRFMELSADFVTAAGGLDRAAALWDTFYDKFFTDEEKRALALSRASETASQELADIGLAVEDFAGEEGLQRFKDLFLSELPDLSAEAIADWLEAAAALSALVDVGPRLVTMVGDVLDVVPEATDATYGFVDATEGLVTVLEDVTRGVEDATYAFGENVDGRAPRSFGMGGQTLTGWQLIGGRTAPQPTYTSYTEPLLAPVGPTIIEPGEAVDRRGADAFAQQIEDDIALLDGSASDFALTVRSLVRDFVTARDEAERLGVGIEGVTTRFQLQLEQAAVALELRGKDLAAELYGTPLEEIEARIAELTGPDAPTYGGDFWRNQQELTGLYEDRDRMIAEQEAAERFLAASELATVVADLAGARGLGYEEVAGRLGFDLADLAQDLGIDESELAGYLGALEQDSFTLDELGMTIEDILGSEVDRIVDVLGGDSDDGGEVALIDAPERGGGYSYGFQASSATYEAAPTTTLADVAARLDDLLRATRESQQRARDDAQSLRNAVLTSSDSVVAAVAAISRPVKAVPAQRTQPIVTGAT